MCETKRNQPMIRKLHFELCFPAKMLKFNTIFKLPVIIVSIAVLQSKNNFLCNLQHAHVSLPYHKSTMLRKGEYSMKYIYVNHKVKDFASWKPYFYEDETERLKYGIELSKLFCAANDSNDVHILFEVSNPRNAQKFFENPRLKELMQKAGVVSEPIVHILQPAA